MNTQNEHHLSDPDAVHMLPEQESILHDVTDEKLAMAGQGTRIAFDPAEADLAGAFMETALSLDDAVDAEYDDEG